MPYSSFFLDFHTKIANNGLFAKLDCIIGFRFAQDHENAWCMEKNAWSREHGAWGRNFHARCTMRPAFISPW